MADVIATITVLTHYHVCGRCVPQEELHWQILYAIYIGYGPSLINKGKYHLPHSSDEVLFKQLKLKIK